jgi:hypothetical protein
MSRYFLNQVSLSSVSGSKTFVFQPVGAVAGRMLGVTAVESDEDSALIRAVRGVIEIDKEEYDTLLKKKTLMPQLSSSSPLAKSIRPVEIKVPGAGPRMEGRAGAVSAEPRTERTASASRDELPEPRDVAVVERVNSPNTIITEENRLDERTEPKRRGRKKGGE